MQKSKVFFLLTVFSLLFVSKIFSNNNENKELERFNKAIDNYTKLIRLYEDSSVIYEKGVNYEMAYECFLLHLQYTDTLRKTIRDKKVFEAEQKYNIDQAEKDLKLLEQSNEIVKQEVKINNVFIYVISITTLLGLIIFYLVFQINKIKSRRKRAELIERNLRQQLSPEFILDSIDSIQSSLFSENKNDSQKNLSKFAKYMRQLLDNSQYNCISLKKEIDLTLLYIELEGYRRKDNINTIINIDENVDTIDFQVPPFLIQSVIESEISVGSYVKYNNINIDILEENNSIELHSVFSLGEVSLINQSNWVRAKDKRDNRLFKLSYKNANLSTYYADTKAAKKIILKLPKVCEN